MGLATKKGTVTFTRECDHCGHRYQVRVNIDASGATPYEASEHFEKQAAPLRDGDTFEVLCPSCDRFAKQAMARHLPRGFRGCLLDVVKGAANWALFVGIAVLLLTSVAACLVVYFLGVERWAEHLVASAFWLLLFSSGIAFGTTRVIRSIRQRMQAPEVAQWIEALSELRCERLVRELYEATGPKGRSVRSLNPDAMNAELVFVAYRREPEE